MIDWRRHHQCWLASYGRMEHGDPMTSCDGRLVRAHLIARQELKKVGADENDPATWVWACGGPTGVGGHHGAFDFARTLRVDRTDIPPQTVEFAIRHGLLWYLDRVYAQRVRRV